MKHRRLTAVAATVLAVSLLCGMPAGIAPAPSLTPYQAVSDVTVSEAVPSQSTASSTASTSSPATTTASDTVTSFTQPLSTDTKKTLPTVAQSPLPTEAPFVPQTVTKTYQALTVKATLPDAATAEPTVRTAAEQALFPQSMPGRLSDAYTVTAETMPEDGLLLTFSFESAGASAPTIYRFESDSQQLTAIETAASGTVATASVLESGTYILLDRTVYEGAFIWEDRFGASDIYAGVEVVLVMDDSGSMRRSDRDNKRLTVAADLLARLPHGSRVGVVRVATEAEALTPSLTADRADAAALLTDTHFISNGNTAMYTGIQKAVALLEDSRPLAQKAMIILSDGFPTDFALYDETVALTQAHGVQAYCVTLGTERMNTVHSLFEFASAVEAPHFTAETADELTVVYDDISRLVDLATDTDGDTIPDYYEEHMVAFNGVTVPLDKTNADSDGDGIPDNEEVSVELIVSEDGSQVLVKGMLLSDPSLSDSDGDGDPDNTDTAPFNNTFWGTVTSKYLTTNVNFTMDYNWFAGDNTVYNPALSQTSALFASLAYATTSMTLSDDLGERTISAKNLGEVLTYFGMENAVHYSLRENYNDVHLSEVIVGHRTVPIGGQLRTVLAVVVRGTDTTIEEWSSNCDIGDITKDTDKDDWINTDNHKGFDIAANRIARFVEQYIADCGLYKESLIYWLTGHSRGAGIANILGASLEKQGATAFTYTFASPATTLATDTASYRTVFNIINTDDFVPCLPIASWGYSCYGVTSGVSIRDSYESMWENYTGVFDYNSDANGMDSCITEISKILTSGMDPRVDCYRYTCSCHGDGSNDTVTIKNTGMSESSREKAIAKIPQNALSACHITRYDGGWVGGWDFEVCQTPAYFMQLLAAFMAEEIDAYRFAVELNIADRYESAKTALIDVGISGVEHPHYAETYYFLATYLTADDIA